MNQLQFNQIQDLFLTQNFPLPITPKDLIPKQKTKKKEKKPHAYNVYKLVFIRIMELNQFPFPRKNILNMFIFKSWHKINSYNSYIKEICKIISNETYNELKSNPSISI